jgi:hypothetical protein
MNSFHWPSSVWYAEVRIADGAINRWHKANVIACA